MRSPRASSPRVRPGVFGLGVGLICLGVLFAVLVGVDALKGKPASEATLVLAGTLAIGGVAMLLAAGAALRRDRRIVERATTAEATVTRVAASSFQITGLDAQRWVVEFTYQDQLGNTRTGKSGYLDWSDASTWRAGDLARILIDEQDPGSSLWVGDKEGPHARGPAVTGTPSLFAVAKRIPSLWTGPFLTLVGLIMLGIGGSGVRAPACLLAGAALFERGARKLWASRGALRHGVPGEAFITRIRRSALGSRITDWQYLLCYRYTDPGGRSHNGRGYFPQSAVSGWKPGDRGSVLYDPDRPRRSVWVGVARAIAAFCAAACLCTLSSVRPANAQTAGVHRFVWHGHIDDEAFLVSRAKSAGDAPNLPEPYSYGHSIKVDFEYVQEVAADGSESWPRRHLSWTLQSSQNDDTFTETCRGGGSLDLGPSKSYSTLTNAQHEALQGTCEHKQLAIAFRLYGKSSGMPPLPEIPTVSDLDENCAYRKEQGTRRTSIWLTPEVDAVVEMDTKPGSEYAGFVPEPGKWVELTVRTVPAYPARFRFVIDKEHTSNFAGYAGNAYIDKWFFKRYHLQHLTDQYSDLSPDLIFDPQMFGGKGWSRVSQDVVETAEEGTMAMARVTAMDYGAIGKVRVYAKYKCGGWTPAKILVGGKPHDAVSVPLDEDNNLMADALEDYKGDPGRDDDDEPEGDGTKGDGLTAFEEYRGFMVEGEWHICEDPLTDEHIRTTPRHKHLFVYASTDPELERYVEEGFGWASNLSVIPVCRRHLWGVDTVLEKLEGWTAASGFLSVPPETRVVNFTLGGRELWDAPVKFEGQVVHAGRQHGVILGHDSPFQPQIGSLFGLAVPTEPGLSMGSPKRTAIVLVVPQMFSAPLELMTVIHEMGHAVGVPHHSDSRKNWRVVSGILDVTPGLSPAQSKGLPIDSQEAAVLQDQELDALLIEPGRACRQGDPAAVYRGGNFAGCLAEWIVRRGQQESGSTNCPMCYFYAGVYEPPGVRTAWRWRDLVTDVPDLKPDPSSHMEHWWNVDAWGGELLRWKSKYIDWGASFTKFCSSTAGTNENAGPGESNLAGDAGRAEPCSRFIVVNDNATSDPR